MKRIILTSALIFSLAVSCFAQEKSTNDLSKNPLFILKVAGQPDILYDAQSPRIALSTINQRSIKSMEVLKDNTATKLFGERGAYGVITLTLVDSAKLIEKNMLLTKYNIEQNARTLPIYIDGIAINNSGEMYFDPQGVKSVMVVTNAKTNQKYINVNTVNGLSDKLNNSIHIRGK